MINNNMRTYNYFTFGDDNGYGQPALSAEAQGTVLMSVYPTGTSVQDNINYKDANYIGLTKDRAVNDSWVIEYDNKKLKVLYVIKQGRLLTQVFMKEM